MSKKNEEEEEKEYQEQQDRGTYENKQQDKEANTQYKNERQLTRKNSNSYSPHKTNFRNLNIKSKHGRSNPKIKFYNSWKFQKKKLQDYLQGVNLAMSKSQCRSSCAYNSFLQLFVQIKGLNYYPGIYVSNNQFLQLFAKKRDVKIVRIQAAKPCFVKMLYCRQIVLFPLSSLLFLILLQKKD